MPESQTLVIKVGMHCEGCRRKVKKALSKVPGVEELKVDIKEQKVTIRGDIDVKKVMSKLAKTGKVNEILQTKTNAPPAAPKTEPEKPKEAKEAPTPSPPAVSRQPSAPASLATMESATKEAILKDIQMKPFILVDTPDFLSDDNPNACSIM